MRHVLILLLLVCLLWGCGDKRTHVLEEPKESGIILRLRTASPSPTPLDPRQKTLDLCVGNDVISYHLSDMGVMVGSAGVLGIDQDVFSAFCLVSFAVFRIDIFESFLNACILPVDTLL